jgi:hypothetical protein
LALYLQHVSEVLLLRQNILSHQLEQGELGRHRPAQQVAEDRVVGEAHDVLHHPEVRPEEKVFKTYEMFLKKRLFNKSNDKNETQNYVLISNYR